jgi:hypothetical protein
MNPGVLINTGLPFLDELPPFVESFLLADLLEMNLDGGEVTGFRSPDAKSLWIRDHADMLRAGRYFHSDVTSAVQHFADTQSVKGRIFDYVSTFPEKLPCERENWTKYVRVPVEADVEYRFVRGAFLAWQACGDDAWIQALLPRMEKALEYVRSHEWYWDASTRLVKRPYTIDTWDFAYTAGTHDWLQFQVDENTFWGVMHGDNSGYYEAYRTMAFLFRRFGEEDRAAKWEDRARDLQERMNALCWNGAFYTHFEKLKPVEITGVDESAQLSLSNPMAINRGAANHSMAVSIIQEYRRRQALGGSFAEWYSIDPPFPDGVFGDEKLVAGAYVNGGIMPLVGGELALAAFGHGFEDYGVDILKRYHALVSEKGESFLWYFPDGTPASVETSTSPEAQPTDGWGSSAMLHALVVGLAGIEDQGRGFDRLRLSPRWAAADVDEAEARVGYASSGAGVGYTYESSPGVVRMTVTAPDSEVDFHLLLPPGTTPSRVSVEGTDTPFAVEEVRESRYLDFRSSVSGTAEVAVSCS